jgi:hypothetical protein
MSASDRHPSAAEVVPRTFRRDAAGRGRGEGADGPRGRSLQHSCLAVVDGSRVEFKGDRDPVNTAARVEGCTREMSEKVLITESTPDW